jgi:hypothetical protein
MIRRKASIVAQGIGFAVVGLLALRGALGLLQGEIPLLAAIRAAASAPTVTGPSPQSLDAAAQNVEPSYGETPPLTSESPLLEASMPLLISYQGAVPDAEGRVSGTYTMTFRIYASVADPVGRKLWTEQHTAVALRGGYFGEPTVSNASYGLSSLVP